MEKSNKKPKLILQSALIVLLASLGQTSQTVFADSDLSKDSSAEVIKNTTEELLSEPYQSNAGLEKTPDLEKSLENSAERIIRNDENAQGDDSLASKSLIEQAKDIHKEKYETETSEKLDGRGIVIASVDSGVDPNHEALKLDDVVIKNHLKIKKDKNGLSDKIPYVFDFMSGDNSIKDPDTEHGMHIAGVLVGNSKNGFKGLAPNAQLLAYRTWSKGNDS